MQLSPTVCTTKTKEFSNQLENDEFGSELNDKYVLLELINFSTIPLLYMTEGIQKDSAYYRRAFEINGMAIAWDVSDVCEREKNTRYCQTT